jgi:hypothetical protein
MVTSSYSKLNQYLQHKDQDMLRLSFKEIENILGSELPPSAYEHRAWWANSANHSHAQYGWIQAGYETASVDLDSQQVSFLRQQKTVRAPSPAYQKSMRLENSVRSFYPRADLDDIIQLAGGIDNLGEIIHAVQAYINGDLLETELGRDLRKLWPRR